jgi:hypothetical protein
MMNGTAGHTYGANGIWQCNRPGDPHGKSPHGGTYGTIPWNEAMRLPGSEQVGFGKRFLTHYAWEKFEPHPEWAGWVGDDPAKPHGEQADYNDFAPQSSGIPGIVRVTYVPEGRSVVVRKLPSHATCSAAYFDPVSGQRTEFGPIRPSDDGSWTCSPPAGCTHDWVVVVEEKSASRPHQGEQSSHN